jgi:hypothetical protein
VQLKWSECVIIVSSSVKRKSNELSYQIRSPQLFTVEENLTGDKVITALSLISALYKLLHAKFPQFAFTSRFLVTDLNNEGSPASVLTLLLPGEYPQLNCLSQSYFTTGSLPPISLSCRQAPWDSRTEIFLTEPLRKLSLCNILSDEKMGLPLMYMLGFLSSVHFATIACYWKFFLLHYIQVFCQYGLCRADQTILRVLCFNGSLVTWKVVSLTTAKFKPLITHLAGLGSSLYSLVADPTENTASNSFSIVVVGGCLAISWILLTCLSAATKQRMFLLAIVA